MSEAGVYRKQVRVSANVPTAFSGGSRFLPRRGRVGGCTGDGPGSEGRDSSKLTASGNRHGNCQYFDTCKIIS